MNNFDLKKFLTENKLTSNSRVLKEAVMWNWDGDRNSLEEVPPKFKAAVKAEIGDELDDDTFEEAFDGIKNFHADEAGEGEQTFNSDHWAEQIEMDYLQEDQESDHQFYANQEGEEVIMQIAKTAINLMDEQPGTSAHIALQSVLDDYIEENGL